MTADTIVSRLLEAEPPVPPVPDPVTDPDDPEMVVKNYRGAFEKLGFNPSSTDEGDQRWIWREGNLEIEIVKFTPENAGDIPFGPALRAHATNGGYAIWAYILVPDATRGELKNAYAHKIVKTERRAYEYAAQFQKELPKSMAARLTRLGFTGWKNYWHKSPIHVHLKPSYVNIDLELRYTPNDQAIRVLTGLDKMCNRLWPERKNDTAQQAGGRL